MAEEITAVCPNCGQQYTLSAEYIGGEAECENCHNTFVIQAAEAQAEVPAPEAPASEAQAEAPASEAPAAEGNPKTSTVKLQRVPGNIGMVPDVDDQFHLEVAQTASGKATGPSAAPTATGTSGKRVISSPIPKKKPWWKIF